MCPKLIALGCDGASVTTGHRNGLFGLLKQEQPSVVLIHCLAHRLKLAFCDASKSSGLHEKAVSTLLMGLYYFYRNSTLNRSMLKRAGASLGIKNVLVPNRVCTTRWVGHLHRSIEIVLKSYPIIVTHLQQITQTDIKINTIQAAKAKCFLKLLLTKDLVLYLHLLLDICEPLRKLSNAFQERSAVVSDVYRAISSSIVILKKLNTNPGSHLQKVVDLDDFCGHALSGNDGSFKASKIKMLTNLNSALEKHFGDFKEGIFKFCDIAKFNSWPLAANTDEIQDFGDKEVRKIMDHFHDVLVKAGADLDCIENQWTSLKSVIYDEHEAADITHLTWPNIVRKYQDSHQDILCVIDIILSLPASSAEVERGFSSLKLLKNDFRSTLSENHLNDLMAIKLLIPDDEDFDPMQAIKYWNSAGTRPRRPSVKDRHVHSHSGKPVSSTGPLLAHATEASPPDSDSDNSDGYTSEAGLEEDEITVDKLVLHTTDA